MDPPADLEAWKRYVTNIVSRYEDVVRAWEVWNEPDLQAFWVGTPTQYAELLAVTYETVGRADPTATVVLGGLSLGGSPGRLNPKFLEEILADPLPIGQHSFGLMLPSRLVRSPKGIQVAKTVGPSTSDLRQASWTNGTGPAQNAISA